MRPLTIHDFSESEQALCIVFESDSEHLWLPIIQTPVSHKLNPITSEAYILQNGVVTEVAGVTKRLRTVEKRGSLDDLLLSAIDETMKQVFSAGLDRLLGSGAPVIETKGCGFSGYIKELSRGAVVEA